jgi:hypothetical protein
MCGFILKATFMMLFLFTKKRNYIKKNLMQYLSKLHEKKYKIFDSHAFIILFLSGFT